MKFTNRALKIMIIIAFIIIGFNTKCLATTGVVNIETVRMRKDSSTQSSIVTLLSMNDKIEVEEKVGDWYKVSYKNYNGYVLAKYVTVKEEVPEYNTPEEVEKNQEPEQSNQPIDVEQNNSSFVNTVEVVEDEITVKNIEKLYILPLITSSVISDIKPETKLNINLRVNGWSYVQTGEICGWIRTDKLYEVSKEQTIETSNTTDVAKDAQTFTEQEKNPIQTENSAQDETPNQNANPEPENDGDILYDEEKTKYVNSASINVREEPSTDSKKITSLTINEEVTVIGEFETWYKVRINNEEGYIAKRLLSDTKTQITSRSETAKKTNQASSEKLDSSDTSNDEEEQSSNNESSSNKNSNNSSKGDEVVAFAKKYLGYKYVSGGTSPKTGFDCSGFTTYVYKNFGVSLSRTSTAQASNGVSVSKDNLQSGDILIYKDKANAKIGHVGIYIGSGKFIHASTPSTGVIISSMSEKYYSSRYVGARRVI